MKQFPEGKMPFLLKLICSVLIAISFYCVLSLVTGIVALSDAQMSSDIFVFTLNHLITASIMVVPLLVFVRLVHAATVSKEFFSKKQSQRMLTIAICFAIRVVLDLLAPSAPSIEVPALPNGAVGSMSVGPSLNFTTLAISLMFFALTGVFEYGRKLQEDSDNIL